MMVAWQLVKELLKMVNEEEKLLKKKGKNMLVGW